MDHLKDEEIVIESLESQSSKTSDDELDSEKLLETVSQPNDVKDEFEIIYNQIENAFTKNNTSKELTFPMPTKWIGPRLFAFWIFRSLVNNV